MPEQTLRLTSGVNTSETPTLNAAGIATSQLVRFKPDPQGSILVEKLGGWAKFYLTQISQVVRAVFGWEDTNANKWLAYGTSDPTSAHLVAVGCTTDGSGITTASGSVYQLTPQYFSDLSKIRFETTSGSSQVKVTDPYVSYPSGFSFTLYSNLYTSVFIAVPISVGGIVFFGTYAITALSGNSYYITATNKLGMPQAAAYTAVAAGIVVTAGAYGAGPPATLTLTYGVLGSPPFIVGESVNLDGVNPTSWNGSGIVQSCTTTQTVIAAPFNATNVAWVAGGLLSNWGVTPVISADNTGVVTVTLPDHGQTVGSTFTILNQLGLGTTASGVLYGDYVVGSVTNAYTFSLDTPYLPLINTNPVYQGGNVVTGGSSTVGAVTLTVSKGFLSYAALTISAGSSTIANVTLIYNSRIPIFSIGSSIVVSGVSPSAWNGTYTVTNSTGVTPTTCSVTYALVGAALSWVSGGTIQAAMFNVGATIQVSNVTPTAWNGTYVVTGATSTTITYALVGAALSWVSGGNVSDIGGDALMVYASGIPTPSSDPPFGSVSASNWSLSNWGEVLLSSQVGFSPVSYSTDNFQYSPISAWNPLTNDGVAAIPIAAGPSAVTGFFIAMPSRQVVAWGTTFTGAVDPLLIRWSDVSNYNVWIGQITNQAGSYHFSSGSAIIGAMQASNNGLIWTDLSLWLMQYIGPPYVFSFNEVSRGCGLIARKAAGIMNNITYWMGSSQFFNYSGEGVQPIVCPVWDAIFQDLDKANVSKIFCAVNSLFQEVTWFYPVAGGSGECSAYVKYSLLTQMWDIGTLPRTAWLDNSVLGPPIGFDSTALYIQQHEISKNAGESAMSTSFTTGGFAIAEGNNKAFLDEVWPDFKWGYYNQSQGATVQITFSASDFPGQTPTTYGPYSVTQATQWFNPRIRARLISVTVSSTDMDSFWRLGALRYRVVPDGRY